MNDPELRLEDLFATGSLLLLLLLPLLSLLLRHQGLLLPALSLTVNAASSSNSAALNVDEFAVAVEADPGKLRGTQKSFSRLTPHVMLKSIVVFDTVCQQQGSYQDM